MMRYRSLIWVILVSITLLTVNIAFFGSVPAINDAVDQESTSRQVYPAAVEGYVTFAEGGAPIPNVYAAAEGDGPEIYTFTNETGYYCLNLTHGEWYIQINQSGFSGYSDDVELDPQEVMTLDVQLYTDITPPEINSFELSRTEAISAHQPAEIYIEFTEKYYRTVELAFSRVIERADSKVTTSTMIMYTNTNDHQLTHARDIEVTEEGDTGVYSGTINWNAVSTGYRIYREGGSEEGSIYPEGAFAPADNRMGGDNYMITAIYTKENYDSDVVGVAFVQDHKITEFYYMGGGDQAQVDLDDTTSALQFVNFYMTSNDDFTGHGPPEWGYMSVTDAIPISEIILKPSEVVPSGEYIVSFRVEDWGNDDTKFQYYTVNVDTDAPVVKTGGPYEASQLEKITLDAGESFDEETGIISYTWTINPVEQPDGQSGYPMILDGKEASLTLEDIGKYTVDLSVTDEALNTGTSTTKIIVTDGIAPKAVAIEGQTIYAGEKALFDASDSSDNVGIVNYTWTIEGDEPVVFYGAEAHYIFTETGNYTVSLTVSDAEGNFDTYSTWVNVVEKPPSDTAAPKVIDAELEPLDEATGISIEAKLVIPFDEALEISTLYLKLGYMNGESVIEEVPGTIVYDELKYVVTFTPKELLDYETNYKLTLSVEDLYSNLLKNYLMSFTTESAPVLPDHDNDEIPDSEDTDDDNDGMPDSWEDEYDLDPYNASDAELDRDGDGLSNAEEYSSGTDPGASDTDGDGLPDDWELKYDLDASDSTDAELDDDDDGLSNLDEFQEGSDPTIPSSDIQDKSGDADASNGPLYIAIAVIAAVIIAILVYTMFYRRPRYFKDLIENSGHGPEPENDEIEDKKPDNIRRPPSKDGPSTTKKK